MNQYDRLRSTLEVKCPSLTLLEHEPLASYTSFKIGGPVPLMAAPADEHELCVCVVEAKKLGLRVEVIGNGSNLLISDEGVDAFFIQTGKLTSIIKTAPQELTVGSGALLSRASVFAAQYGLTGLEFAHGIPGSLGGAVTMNAGAYDGEMAKVITKTSYIDADGVLKILCGPAHEFQYRHSFFSSNFGVIVSSVIQLQAGDEASVKARMAELAAKRRNSQPLEYPSAGSTFKRPQGHYAAALIDQCGLKGLRVGDAQVSTKHGGFVVNLGSATCEDVLGVIEAVKNQVFEKTGVTLDMEVKLLQ